MEKGDGAGGNLAGSVGAVAFGGVAVEEALVEGIPKTGPPNTFGLAPNALSAVLNTVDGPAFDAPKTDGTDAEPTILPNTDSLVGAAVEG